MIFMYTQKSSVIESIEVVDKNHVDKHVEIDIHGNLLCVNAMIKLSLFSDSETFSAAIGIQLHIVHYDERAQIELSPSSKLLP